jgi:hypothetical protein
MMWQDLRVLKGAMLASPSMSSAGDEDPNSKARNAYITRQGKSVSPSHCETNDTSNEIPCVETLTTWRC